MAIRPEFLTEQIQGDGDPLFEQIVRFLQSKEVKASWSPAIQPVPMRWKPSRKNWIFPSSAWWSRSRVACETTVNDRIGVIGTEATVHSGIYTSFIRRQKPDVQVVSKACPLFVPLVEEGWLKDPITMEVARRYLEELLQYDIMYGEQYVYNGNPPITEGHMQMGVKDVELTDLVPKLDEGTVCTDRILQRTAEYMSMGNGSRANF